MKRIILFTIIVFIIFSSVSWANTVITLSQKEVVVDGEDVYLRDIAKIEGDLKNTLSTLRIITSPSPGNIRILEKKYIILRIHQAGFDSGISLVGPETITIKRAYQEIQRDLIRSLIEEKIKDIIPKWAKRYTIYPSIPNFSSHAPIGDLDIFIDIPSREKLKGRSISFPVTISINGNNWRRIYVSVKVSLFADVPVAISEIKKGEKITRDRYKIEEREIKEIAFPYISPDELRDFVALKNIYPGNIITLSCVSRPYQIKRGDIVDVVLIRGPITIKLKAQALQNGVYGDLIQLKNLKSGKKFTGIVKDYGLVIVK